MLIPNESAAAPSCYDAFKEEKSAPIDNQNISNHDAALSAPLAAVSPNFSNFQNTQLQHASTMVPNNYYQNNQLQHASSNAIQGHNCQNQHAPPFSPVSMPNPCNHQINVSNQHSQNISYGSIGESMAGSKQEDSEEITNKKMNKMMNVMTMVS